MSSTKRAFLIAASLTGASLGLALGASLAAVGCAKQQSTSGSGGGPVPTVPLPNGSTLPQISGPNVMKLTVNGSTCNAANSYQNKPCVSITVCSPGATPPSADCQTISDILLDTGSFGLRLFSSVLTVQLNSLRVNASGATGGTNYLAECATFDTGSDWGPVMSANVVLGTEAPVTVPVHVFNSTFAGSAPSSCGTVDTSPSQAGFNGILGVGLFGPDCGQTICGSAASSWYYSCSGTGSGSTCNPVAVANAIQVTNPVYALPVDNNGVIVELPSILPGGTPSIEGGYLVLGIGTENNNTPTGVTAYSADAQQGTFQTNFNNTPMTSFVDSGSNAYYFPDSNLPDCAPQNPGWFCPSSTQLLSATDTAASGSPQGNVQFLVGNTNTLLSNQSNNVFIELAGDGSSIGGFDWGLPFYIGRNIYVGIEGRSTPQLSATGPFWAF